MAEDKPNDEAERRRALQIELEKELEKRREAEETQQKGLLSDESDTESDLPPPPPPQQGKSIPQASAQQSRRPSQFAFQCCNLLQLLYAHTKYTNSSQFAFKSSILRCSKWVSNGE